MPSYSNYQTYLKYKNCCRPIGDTGPTGPAATIDIPGNKGEILYFSETDTLDNTNNVFIQQANVTINNNLVVTGNLSMNNQFINDVSGIIFTQGNLLFSDFSSVYQSVQLPSSQGQPISLERKTLFYKNNITATIPSSGGSYLIEFDKPLFNQLDLSLLVI